MNDQLHDMVALPRTNRIGLVLVNKMKSLALSEIKPQISPQQFTITRLCTVYHKSRCTETKKVSTFLCAQFAHQY
jgi:hypothetical protein